ncbi:hypothetical protein HK101_008378 [Irineochytrium annulatum]|nr:hypothetical protein HK101_008378 [Irineochytrium annulatum]
MSSSQQEDVEEEGVIRCLCGYDEDDGYTIQCDRCKVWQHLACLGIESSKIPDEYLCEECDPRAVDVETQARRIADSVKKVEKESKESKRKDPIKTTPKKHRREATSEFAKPEKDTKKSKKHVKERESHHKDFHRDKGADREDLKGFAGPPSPPRKRQVSAVSLPTLKLKAPFAEKGKVPEPRPTEKPLRRLSRSPEPLPVHRRGSQHHRKSELLPIPKLANAFEVDYYLHAYGFSITDFNFFGGKEVEAYTYNCCLEWEGSRMKALTEREISSQIDVDDGKSFFDVYPPDQLYPMSLSRIRSEIYSAYAVSEEIPWTDEGNARKMRQIGLFVPVPVEANVVVGEIIGQVTVPSLLNRNSVHSKIWDVEKRPNDRYVKKSVFEPDREVKKPLLASPGFQNRKTLLPPVLVQDENYTALLSPPFTFPHPAKNLRVNAIPLIVDTREESSLNPARYVRWHCDSAKGDTSKPVNACLRSVIVTSDEGMGGDEPCILNERIRLCVVSTRKLSAGEEVIIASTVDGWMGYPCSCCDDGCPIISTVMKYEEMGIDAESSLAEDYPHNVSKPADVDVSSHLYKQLKCAVDEFDSDAHINGFMRPSFHSPVNSSDNPLKRKRSTPPEDNLESASNNDVVSSTRAEILEETEKLSAAQEMQLTAREDVCDNSMDVDEIQTVDADLEEKADGVASNGAENTIEPIAFAKDESTVLPKEELSPGTPPKSNHKKNLL